MAIQSFHFYKIQTLVSSACFPRILVTACTLIDYVQSLSDQVPSLAMSPIQLVFGLLLASVALVRVLKSTTACQALETTRARSSIFTAINLAKQMSVDSADLAAKIVTILKSIWNSNKAFRKADGTEFSALRIRSRLVLSPVLDTVWWWRDEFDPHSRSRGVVDPTRGNAYARSQSIPTTDTDNSGPRADAVQEMAGSLTTFSAAGHPPDAFLPDEEFMADFEWALADEALFSLDPLPCNWSTTNNLL